MSLKKWLQKNQVFDRDLLKIFPEYGVNDPENDLKNLTPDQWKEIQAKITTDRAKELKDNAAKLRFQKKLTKIEKLWRQQRPKKKKKAPKLLNLFDDTAATDTKTSSSPTKSNKSKKGSRSPSKKKSKTPTKSKDNGGFTPSKQNKTKSEQNESKPKQSQDKKSEEKTEKVSQPEVNLTVQEENELAAVLDEIETEKVKTEEKAVDVNAEWDRYDDLKLTDDDEEDEKKKSESPAPSLWVPFMALKTQGSVVDMLMDGPQSKRKEKNKIIPRGVMVTPPDEPSGPIKDYKLTVSFNGDTKEKEEDDIVDKANDNMVGMNGVKTVYIYTDEKNAKKVLVCLNADRFVYNEENKRYYVSLSGCTLMKSDFVDGTISFEIKSDLVNVDKSDKVEHNMDDKYIDKVLDEIHENNPDTDD